jgi:hypothetical protein
MISDTERETVTLRLLDGTIHTTDCDARASYQTEFRSYDVNLDLRATLADAQRPSDDPNELTIDQLRRRSTRSARRASPSPPSSSSTTASSRSRSPASCSG